MDNKATKKAEGEAIAAPAPDDVLKQILAALTSISDKLDSMSKEDDSEDSTDGDEAKADDDGGDVDAKSNAATAVAQDRDRLKAISEACGEARATFAMSQFLAGKSAVEAKAALADVLISENIELTKKVSKAAKSDGIEPLALGKPVDEANAPDQLWAKNVDNVQEKFSGKKEYFLAALKYDKAKSNKAGK